MQAMMIASSANTLWLASGADVGAAGGANDAARAAYAAGIGCGNRPGRMP